jgi:hypothetical protein
VESRAIRPASRAPAIPEPKSRSTTGPEGTPAQRPVTVNNQGLASTREELGFTQSSWDG